MEHKENQKRICGVTSYKTLSSSVVLSLRPGFKDFFSHQRWPRKYRGFKHSLIHLFYKWLTTGCSFQSLLENANFGHVWCQKMRQQRTSLVIDAAKKRVLSKWTPYYRSQSGWGLYQQMCERYPEVRSCLEAEDGQEVPRCMYNSLCKWQGQGQKQKQGQKWKQG